MNWNKVILTASLCPNRRVYKCQISDSHESDISILTKTSGMYCFHPIRMPIANLVKKFGVTEYNRTFILLLFN